LIDECLPSSFADFFVSRGYDVHVVGKTLPSGSPDANIVAAAFDLGAIVVTTDAHFRPLKASAPGYGGKIDRADRIFF
jgi:predicted nuclease of predicted toxin-antitoxin system